MREGTRNKPQGPGVFHGFRHIYFQYNVFFITCFHCLNQVLYLCLIPELLPIPYIVKFLSSVDKFVMHLVTQLGSSFLYGCAQVTILLSELCHGSFGVRWISSILGDPGADSRGEGNSKRAEKHGTKKSKERREEHLGTMSYQTSSKRSPPF